MTDTGSTKRMNFTFDHAFGETATWVKQGGSYVYKKVSDAEKQKLAFYQKLYKEGLFDKDYVTTKWDTMEDKLYTSKVGMVFEHRESYVIYTIQNLKRIRMLVLSLFPGQGCRTGLFRINSKRDPGMGHKHSEQES